MVRASTLSLVGILAVVLAAPLGAQAPAAAPQTPRKRAPARRAAPAPSTPAPAPATPAAEPAPPPSDVKIVTAVTQGAQVTTSTTFIRGPRQRTEFPRMVTLDQCDLQRTVMLSPATRKYRLQGYATPGAPATPVAIVAPGGEIVPPRGGIVAMTTTVTDTGERQTLFGLEARHIRTVVTRQPSKDACDKARWRTEVDAWYVDLPATGSACTRPPDPAPESTDACQDRVESQLVGEARLGFPVKTTTTVVSGEGDTQRTTVSATDVRALEITRLDAALFDLPPDFTETSSVVDLAPSLGTGDTLQDALFGSTADGTGEAAPKATGAIRIGVLEPVNTSGRASLQMRALRQELVSRLNRTPYEALALKGSSPRDITADMTRLACDYVLLAEVVEAKTSKPGKVGGMLRMASGGGPAKDRHEVTIAYRLFPADGTATIATQGDAKADNGGGFSLGSALRVAAFAGQMYMGLASAGMMRGLGGGGLGMGMGMMNPMMYGFGGGGLGTGLSGMPGLDDAEQEIAQVALQAAGNVGGDVFDAMKKTRGTR